MLRWRQLKPPLWTLTVCFLAPWGGSSQHWTYGRCCVWAGAMWQCLWERLVHLQSQPSRTHVEHVDAGLQKMGLWYVLNWQARNESCIMLLFLIGTSRWTGYSSSVSRVRFILYLHPTSSHCPHLYTPPLSLATPSKRSRLIVIFWNWNYFGLLAALLLLLSNDCPSPSWGSYSSTLSPHFCL